MKAPASSNSGRRKAGSARGAKAKGARVADPASEPQAAAVEPSELWLLTRDVADRLQMDPITVRKMARRRKLPYYRLGGRYRFRLAEVEAALALNSHVPALTQATSDPRGAA